MQNVSSPGNYQVKWAQNQWEVRETRRIRQKVFCAEQQVFDSNDSDELDPVSQPLIAMTCVAGMPEQAVGTVRIHQSDPGTWWGSRLAVENDFRGQGAIGAALIRLAVSSANSEGCNHFFAHVQKQNETLFQKLHWHTLDYTDIHGLPHARMQADLDYYPPMASPQTGFWIKGRKSNRQNFSELLEHFWWGGKLHGTQ